MEIGLWVLPIALIIWMLFGWYLSYRMMKYGVLKDQKYLEPADIFVMAIINPLIGQFAAFFTPDCFGLESKTKIKNPFFIEEKIKE